MMWTCRISKSLDMSTTLSTTLASSNRNLVSWPNESLTADQIHDRWTLHAADPSRAAVAGRWIKQSRLAALVNVIG